MKPIRSIAFVTNITKPGAAEIAEHLIGTARAAGVEVAETTAYPLPPGFLRGRDACCAIGGDGTILGLVWEAVRDGVPVLGVNLGKLGFMATYTVEEAGAKFGALLEGNYTLAERTLLNCTGPGGEAAHALNDVVIKIRSSHLVRLGVYSGEEKVNDYACDGLIFSTPTGSTAYNLSAGGPLVHPGARVITMTPICPHTLSHRSVVFDHRTRLRVLLHESHYAVEVSVDGRGCFEGSEGFPLEVTIAPQTFQLVQDTDSSYYRVLRRKLRWGEEIGP